MSFAKAVLSGSLTSDPEKRFTPNNHTVTNFWLAVENGAGFSRSGNNEPFLVKVTCWRNLAEAVATQLRKGDFVQVEGKLLMNSFQDQDGVQKKLFEVEAVSIDKLPGKPEAIVGAAAGGESSGGYGAGGGYSAAPAMATSAPSMPAQSSQLPAGHFSSEDLLTEDDIPF